MRPIDAVLVGAVDLPSDVRTQQTRPTNFCGCAAVMVLMRLDDAQRDGRAVYAVIDGGDRSSLAVDAADEIGDAGAAASMASLVKACLVTEQKRARPSSAVIENLSDLRRLRPDDRKRMRVASDGPIACD